MQFLKEIKYAVYFPLIIDLHHIASVRNSTLHLIYHVCPRLLNYLRNCCFFHALYFLYAYVPYVEVHCYMLLPCLGCFKKPDEHMHSFMIFLHVYIMSTQSLMLLRLPATEHWTSFRASPWPRAVVCALTSPRALLDQRCSPTRTRRRESFTLRSSSPSSAGSRLMAGLADPILSIYQSLSGSKATWTMDMFTLIFS